MIFSEDKRLSVYYISRIKFPFRNFNIKSILRNESSRSADDSSPFNSGSKVFLARDNRFRIGVFYCNLHTVTAKVSGAIKRGDFGRKNGKTQNSTKNYNIFEKYFILFLILNSYLF